MPEGPEVTIISEGLNKLLKFQNVCLYVLCCPYLQTGEQ